MDKNFPILAREGWPFIGLALSLLILSILFCPILVVILFLMITIFVVQFFRDPTRSANTNPNEVTSAADGRVIAIEKTRDPFNNRDSLKISVFMNVFNVHSNKAPISGKVTQKIYKPGSFFNAALEKASSENELCAITIKTHDKKIITSVQIAGLIARRILCYASEGETLSKGQRYGFIRFGSRVDHYLPANSKVKVKLGQKVKNTITTLAEI
ncbi:phosphatidylserine decarboxylase [Methylophilaceae bacterium]|jgi:phosphatidylserine decarboxylase|nr:phosphatidylserine decarboxylase [Methylophilaceae bacterium]